MNMIGIASDHAGFELKENLKSFLAGQGLAVEDFGPNAPDSVDYPDYGHKVAGAVAEGHLPRGIAICGSGQGICMTVNKHNGVRAALAWLPEIAKLSREHNDANILCLPARFLTAEQAREIVKVWLDTAFEGGRHARRVNKINI